MGLLPFPRTKRFCFCIRNLKCAAIIITLIGIISSLHRISTISKPQCKKLYKCNNPILIVLLVFLYLFFLCEILFLIGGIALLLSICLKPMTVVADIYISVAIITAVISIIFGTFQFLQGTIADCGFQAEVLSFVAYFIMWTYFVIVINSYRDEMEQRITET